MKIVDDNILIKTKDSLEVQSYITYPQEKNTYPSILIIHEIWGLNDQIKGVARRYMLKKGMLYWHRIYLVGLEMY